MKKFVFCSYKLLFFTFIIIFLFIPKINAETCSKQEKNNLINQSKKIEINPYLNDEYNPMHRYFYNISINNFFEKVYIIDSIGNRFEYEKSYTKDLLFGTYNPGSKITFKVYGSEKSNCRDVKLTTFTISFPYYNDYSNHEKCEEVEEFYLCKRNYSGKIESEEWFLEQIEKYKRGEIENIELETENKNIIKDFFSNKIVQIVLVLIFLLIVYIISRLYVKSRKKVKIDLKKKR